jgi:hypothetical protein
MWWVSCFMLQVTYIHVGGPLVYVAIVWGSHCLCSNSTLALTNLLRSSSMWHPLFVCLGVETTMLWIPQCFRSDHYVSALREKCNLSIRFALPKWGPLNNYLTNPGPTSSSSFSSSSSGAHPRPTPQRDEKEEKEFFLHRK